VPTGPCHAAPHEDRLHGPRRTAQVPAHAARELERALLAFKVLFSDYWPEARVMERVTVAGDRPY
jgi:hypothetical protein